MRATEHAATPEFRGSISRRLTVLTVLFFLLVAAVGGLSVSKTRRIERLHAESDELGTHVQALERLEATIIHLRAEAQDALFLGHGLDDPGLQNLPGQVREQWRRFAEMHLNQRAAWGVGAAPEQALLQGLGKEIEGFLALAQGVHRGSARGPAARRRAATTLHAEAHRLERALQRLKALHHAVIAERTRAVREETAFILWTYLAFIFLGGLAVAGGSVLFVRRMAAPLRRLNAAAMAVARGGFEGRVPVTSRDEIGMLAHTFNRMAEALAERDAQVRRRAQEAEALYRIGTEISSLLRLDRILQTVVESARAMLQTEVAAICLLREGAPQLDIVAVAGPWDAVMGSRQVACCDEPASGRSPVCLSCHEAGAARGGGHLSAALKRGDQVLGALCVGTAVPRAFGDAERDLLGGLAAQAAIAIENARLYEAVRGMAAVEERERLAREMHDGLAQALGFLNLKLALAERGLDGGAGESMRRALSEMRKVAEEAYDEVRQAIFGLRTMVSRGLGLVPTLSEYLHEFSQQAGLQVKLEVPEGDDRSLRFLPEVEVQLVRIVQEALHNVRKHAAARAAWVRLWREGDDLFVAIEDDGAGFDLAAPSPDGRPRFGLSTMRERAEAVGGALAVRSAAGAGTQVVARLPLAGVRRGGPG